MKRFICNRSLIAVALSSFAAFAFFAPSGADAAQGATSWQILQLARPTVFEPSSIDSQEQQYELLATNLGGVPAEGGATIVDTLPDGLTPTGNPEFDYSTKELSPINEHGPCSIAGQVVTCSVFVPIASGGSIQVTVPVDVSDSADPQVENEVTVEGGGAFEATRVSTQVGTTPAPFAVSGVPGLLAGATDDSGNFPTAGSHPYIAKFDVGVTTVPAAPFEASENPRRFGLELPQGLVVNPTATSVRCGGQVLADSSHTNPAVFCPQASQVGTAFLQRAGFGHLLGPLYNVVPPPGTPAALAFEIAGIPIEIVGGLNSNFHLTAEGIEILKRYQIYEVGVTLWGDPSDSRHDAERFGGEEGSPDGCFNGEPCSIEPSPAPFVTMPTSCTEPLTATETVDSWLGGHATGTVPFTDRGGNAGQLSGCNQLAFEPTIESQATTNVAETSSGLDFQLHQRQEGSLEGRATAALKDATVTLPEGMSLNPSAANGLSACTEQQMGYAPEEGKIRFQTTPNTCPDSAKVGSLEAVTPLVSHPLPGSIYVAKPFDNPFGSLLAVYLVVEDEETGVVAKLAGKVEPDPATGRLTARFEESPELPIEDISLHFFNGARGVLTTPLTCGTHTTTSTLTPWSTPEGADAHPTSSFETVSGCAASEGDAPKTVNFTAGTESPLSRAYSPFSLRISRPDGSQHITGVETTLPAGLLAKAAGIPYCPEAGIAQAISREAPEKGKLEQSSPSCPSSSELGTVNVTAGSGIAPVPVTGHVYWAGPYKGAPLSLVVIVPAVTGPFDLGTVVDRVALNVDQYTSRIHAVADPLPTIRDGIPLDVRSIELKLDRPGFTLNPTSCEAKAIEGTVKTQAGQSATLNNRFQVGECARLGFKPKLKLSLRGGTAKGGNPAVKAVVTYPQGEYANIARAQVSLPHSEFLNQAAIAGACVKPKVEAGTCPANSIYGKVKAWTPLLEKPLEGPVYLVGGYGYKLPALVAELDGQIRFLLVGKVDTGKNRGIRNTFEAVPDAPVERFVLELKGGRKYGLLENSENVCRKAQKANVSFKAQNGKALTLKTPIANSCKKAKPKKHKKGKGKKGTGKGRKGKRS